MRMLVLAVTCVASLLGRVFADGDGYALSFSEQGTRVSSRTLTANASRQENYAQYTVEVPKGYVARIAVTGSASWSDSCGDRYNTLSFSGLSIRYGFNRNTTDTHVRWSREPSVITLTLEVSAGSYVDMNPQLIGGRIIYMPITRYYASYSSTVSYSIAVSYYRTDDAYDVVFDANGGTGYMANVRHGFGTAYALPKCEYKKPGCDFLGWATTSNAAKATYKDGQTVESLTLKAGGSVRLYAVWKPYAVYSIAFSANGGAGTPVSAVTATNHCAAPLPPCTWQKEGMRFLGWNWSHSSMGGTMPAGFPFLETNRVQGSTITLHAVWGKVLPDDCLEGAQGLEADILTGGYKGKHWTSYAESNGRHGAYGSCQLSSSVQRNEHEGIWLWLRLKGPGRFCFGRQLSTYNYTILTLSLDNKTVTQFNHDDSSRTGDYALEIPTGTHEVEFSIRGYSTAYDSNARVFDMSFVQGSGAGYVVRYRKSDDPEVVRTAFMNTDRICALELIGKLGWAPPAGRKRFAGWRCSNGRCYDDGMLVFNIAKPGETVTMTAIWE